MYIQLKKNVDINKMNQVLTDMGIKNSFISENDNISWLNDINNNPESPQKHLKPENRELTLDELKSMFVVWTQVGLFHSDLYFSRTSEEDMKKIAEFIVQQQDSIEYIENSEMLIERGEIKEEYHSILTALEKEKVEPEKLSDEEQYIPDLQSGQLLCKSFSLKPFWVVFGNVESPKFMKTKIYKEDVYNELYRDSNGYGYMLIPLYDFSPGFAEKLIERAYDIGLREDPLFFMSYLYNFTISDIAVAADQLYQHYNENELIERFKLSYQKLEMELRSLNKIHDLTVNTRGMIKVNNLKKDSISDNKIRLANAFLVAIKEYKGKLSYIDSQGNFVFAKEKVSI